MSNNNNNIELPLVFFKSKHDNRVRDSRTLVASWNEVKSLLSKHTICEDKDTDMFSVLAYKSLDDDSVDLVKEYDKVNQSYTDKPIVPNTVRRCAANVVAVFALMLDFDSNMTISEAQTFFSEYEYAGYTSFNHLRTPGVHKFRIILPLSEPITPTDLKLKSVSILKWLNNADESTLDISRGFYVPSTSADNIKNAYAWNNTGMLLSLDAFEAEEPVSHEAYTPPAGYKVDEHNANLLLELKKLADSGFFNDYNTWRDLSAGLYNSGFNVTDLKFLSWADSNTQKQCERRWNYLQHNKVGISRGTLITWVRENVNPHYAELTYKGPTLQLVTNKKPLHAEKADYFVLDDEKDFIRPLSKEERAKRIDEEMKNVDGRITLFLAPEGYGKTRNIILDLLKRNKKVIVLCPSGEQAYEKAINDIEQWVREPAFVTIGRRVNVKHIHSKAFNLYKHTGGSKGGVKAKLQPSLYDPFDTDDIDKDDVLERLTIYCKGDAKEAQKVFTRFYTDYQPERAHFEMDDVIVTTFAQARLIINHNKYKDMDESWVFVFDDPSISDISLFAPFDANMKEARAKKNRELIAKQATPMPELIETPDFRDSKRCAKYFQKRIDQNLGEVFGIEKYVKPNTLPIKWIDPSIIYTTTELTTAYLMQLQLRDQLNIIDLMHKVSAGTISVFGTELVRVEQHYLLRPLIDLIMNRVGMSESVFIASGINEVVNLKSSKGRNDYKNKNSFIKLSQPHGDAVLELMDEFNYLNGTDAFDPNYVKALMMMDDLHQALGRNMGYRYDEEQPCEAIVFVDPNYFKHVIRDTRYELQQYSVNVSHDKNPHRNKINYLPWTDHSHKATSLAKVAFGVLKNYHSIINTQEFTDVVNALDPRARDAYENGLIRSLDIKNKKLKEIAKKQQLAA